MDDQKNVIKAIDDCSTFQCRECLREECVDIVKIPKWLAEEVLELLKPHKPILKNDMFFCSECKNALIKTWAFCHKCGRTVKWDELR